MKHKKKNRKSKSNDDASKPKKKRAPAQGPFLVYAIFHTGQNDRCYIGEWWENCAFFLLTNTRQQSRAECKPSNPIAP